MNFVESMTSAWHSIFSNKLRSALTMLGVIIGVAAVIALVSIGQGATARVSAQIEALGSNLVTVTPLRGTQLRLADAAELKERVFTVKEAVPVASFAATLKMGPNTHDTTVEGVEPAYLGMRNFQLSAGRFITDWDVENASRVAVLGAEVAESLGFRASQTVYIQGHPFTVVGVLAPKGGTGIRNEDDTVLIPVTAAARLTGDSGVGLIYLQASSPADAPLAVNHVLRIMRLRYPRPDGEDPVRVVSQDQLLETVADVSKTFTLMLGAIAGISLLVGGIGIMNIMLVSVTERTREIGIRKAIGARRSHILVQFLVESLMLSLTGGSAGVLAGISGSKALSRALQWTPVLSPTAVAMAFACAAAVGLFFGVYPAWRAATLHPVQALRQE